MLPSSLQVSIVTYRPDRVLLDRTLRKLAQAIAVAREAGAIRTVHVALIDKVLASGTKQGYVFKAGPSPTTSEFLWWATAFPEKPGEPGNRFFSNQTGMVFESPKPFEVDEKTCQTPAGLVPVGRAHGPGSPGG